MKWNFIIDDYPVAIKKLNLNVVVAPLVDNVFNRAKSNIKYLEAACMGIPGVFQDLPTYEMTPLKFITGNEMVDQLDFLLKPENFLDYSDQARAYAETMFLENEENLMKHYELYFTPFGSDKRKYLI